MSSTQRHASDEEPRLLERHNPALAATDVFFGGFCLFMVAVSAWGAYRDTLDITSPLVIFGFMTVNAVLSVVSVRVRNPYQVEVTRAVVGAVIAPAAYLLVGGPLAGWWPGFLIMCLGGAIVLGLLTGEPRWGRLLVLYYLALFVLSSLVGIEAPDWYRIALNGGVIAMVGLLFAQIMSLLGQSLQKIHQRTVELQAARDALFAEVEVAHDIQTLLLPKEPELVGHTIRGRMVPAEEVGGDYYDVIHIRDRAFLAIGDVSGHGLTSGLTMMMARSSLLGVMEADPSASLGEIYALLNRALRDNLERMQVHMYMTFALVEYLGSGRFRAVGRHLPFLVYRASTARIEEVEVEGMWLGVLDELEGDCLAEAEFSMESGDLLFLYTDGIIEHFHDGEMFGFERLKDLVEAAAPRGPDAVIGDVLARLRSFDPEVEDDVTMLVVDHRGDSVTARPGARPGSSP